MAIVVEDGSIVTGANSYVTEAELTSYAAARGITIEGDEEELLIKSMDYIESLSFIGIKNLQDQPLQWPRTDVVIDGYIVRSDTIPNELKKGQIETALSIDSGEDPLANVPRLKSSVTVGDLSVTYEKGGSATTVVRKISASLAKLVTSLGGSSFVVNRG